MEAALGILRATGSGIFGGGLYSNDGSMAQKGLNTGVVIGIISSIAQGINDGSIASAGTSLGIYLGLSLVSAVVSFNLTRFTIGDENNSHLTTAIATTAGGLLGAQYGLTGAIGCALASNVSFRWIKNSIKG